MACTVNKVVLKDGSSSQLFQDLSSAMEDSLALETYLELRNNKDKYIKLYGENSQGEVNGTNYLGTPKYKLSNFDSYRQQKDVMDMLAQQFLKGLKQESKTSSKTTLTGINLKGLTGDKLLIPSIVNDIKDNIRDVVDRTPNLPERTKELLLDAAENFESYIVDKGVLGPVGDILTRHGIVIETTEKYNPEDTDDLEEDFDIIDTEKQAIEKVRIYDMSILDTPPSNSILDQLKIYLQGIRKVSSTYKYSENSPTPEYEYTEVGQERAANSSTLYGKLSGVLKGVQSVEEIRYKLKSAIKTDPQLVPIYNDLITEEPIKIPKVGNYKPLEVALFSLAKQDYNMLNIVEMENGDVVLMDANSSSVRKKTAQSWEYNIAHIKKGDTSKIVENIDTFLKSKTLPIRLNKTVTHNGVKSYTPSKSTLSMASKLFVSAGFEGVTSDVLDEVIKKGLVNKELITKDVANLTPLSIITTMLKALPRKAMLSKQDIFSSNWERGEGRSIKLLSEIVGQNKSDLVVGAYLSGKGTLTHPLNYGSAAQDTFTLLSNGTDKGEKYLENFVNDPMYENSKLISIFSKEEGGKDLSAFEVRTMDTLTDSSSNKGVDYGSLSTFDALLTRMNAFFSPASKPSYFNTFTPTQADRGNLLLLTVPKFNIKKTKLDGSIAGEVFSGKKVKAQDVKDWVRNQVKAELTRISNINNHPNIDSYSQKGKEFILFPELNELVDRENITQKEIDSTVERILPVAEEALFNAIQEDIDFYKENQVISDKDQTTFKLNNKFRSRYSNKIGLGSISKANMETFLVNNFIYNYESLLFLSGDPAFYSNNIKLNKRLALPFTPGSKLAVGDATGMNEEYKVKILKEPKMASELADLYETITGDKKKFRDIDLADGWGIASIDRYRRLALSRGTHTDEMLKTLSDIETLKEEDIKNITAIGAKKMFYFKLQKIPSGIMVPFSEKYALFPAIPSLFEQKENGKYKYPTLAEISKELRSGRADEIVMESAFKTGAYNVTTVDNLISTEPLMLHNDFVRQVQVVPNKEKTEDLLGSQMRKLIISNFVDKGTLNLNGKDLSATEALKLYNVALLTMINENSAEVTSELLPNGKVDTGNLARELIKSANNSSHQNTSYITSALGEFIKEGTSILPINYPTLSFKLDNFINSQYRKAVNRLKLPGHSAVQISSFGTFNKNDDELHVASDLKFVRFADKNGKEITGNKAIELAKKAKKFADTNDETLAEDLSQFTVLPAEVRITPMFFLENLRKIANKKAISNDELYSEARKFSTKYGKTEAQKKKLFKNERNRLLKEYQDKEYNRLLKFITKNGEFDMEVLKKAGLDEIVLYRIPTQGKNSMLSAKIKEFLPSSSGNSIQVPAEIVDQSGSDFDIDKVFIEMTDFQEKDRKLQRYSYDPENISNKREAQSAIFDFHRSILSSPKHVAELLMPNDVENLRKVVSDLGVSEATQTGNLASVKLQETFRDNNQAGKNLISMSSIASVGHAVAQHIKPYFKNNSSIAGNEIELGRRYNLKGTGLISSEIAEIQNAAVDNAKEPLLGLLNINSYTASSALLLVSAGHGLKFASAILNAPIVKEVSKAYQKYERIYSPEIASSRAFSEIISRYKIPNNLGPKLFNMDTFTEEQAVSLLGNTRELTLNDNALSLEAFKQFKTLGDQLSKFQRIMNSDSKGTPASTAKLFTLYNDLKSIFGTKANTKEYSSDKLLEGYDMKEQPSPISVNKDKYNDSYLSGMEEKSIHAALKANMAISPSASKHYQNILNTAKEKLGYLSESTQINLLSTYNTYLATNSTSNNKVVSGISKAIEEGKFNYLTQSSHPESTANLLSEYRKAVAEGFLTSNEFIEQLNVVEEGGRSYVTFLNSSSKAVPGDIKADMMHFYEDLMESDNELERKVAKSLADYALVNYGFSTSINSFMEFIPPIAHRIYMNYGDGASLPSVFENLQEEYNNPEIFNTDADKYIDMFIANNSHKLGIETFRNGDEYYEDLDVRYATNKTPLKYARIFDPNIKDYTLYSIDSNGVPTVVPLRGVRNLVVEYHNGPSMFNNDKAHGTMNSEAEKAKASQTNQKVIDNIDQEISAFTDMLGTQLEVDKFTFKTVADIDAFIEKTAKKLATDKRLDEDELELTIDALRGFRTTSKIVFKSIEKRGNLKKETLDSIFKKYYKEGIIEILEGAYRDIINRTC